MPATVFFGGDGEAGARGHMSGVTNAGDAKLCSHFLNCDTSEVLTICRSASVCNARTAMHG